VISYTLSDKQLDEAKNELDELRQNDLSHQRFYIFKVNNAFNELCNSNNSYTENNILKYLVSECLKNKNNLLKIKKIILDFTKQSDYKFLSERSIKKLNTILDYLNFLHNNNINSINKKFIYIKTFKQAKNIKLLNEEIEIIRKYKKSTDTKELEKLSVSYLEKESLLYKNFVADFYSNSSTQLNNHFDKSLFYDFYSIKSNIAKYIGYLALIFTIFGYALYWLYASTTIGYMPSLSENKIVKIGFDFALLLLIVIIFLSSSNYFIYKIYINGVKKSKKISFGFAFSQIYFFVFLFIPFLTQTESLMQYFSEIGIMNFIFENLQNILSTYYILVIICLFCCINWKEFFVDFYLILLFILIDTTLTLCVYSIYKEINFIFFIYTILLLLFLRILSFSPNLSYKGIFITLIVISVIFAFFFNKNIIRAERIGNYFDNVSFNSDTLKNDILKLPTCFNDYNLTCIENESKSKVDINNLFVVLKAADESYYQAFIAENDFNTTIESVANFNLPKCDQNTTMACYVVNKKENNATIKKYHTIFKNIKFDKKQYFINFKIDKNIN
jgi:membrane protein